MSYKDSFDKSMVRSITAVGDSTVRCFFPSDQYEIESYIVTSICATMRLVVVTL